MIPKTGSFDNIPKNFRASLRKTHSEDGSDIFDYMDEGISRSASQYSGILTIAPPISSKNSGDFGHLHPQFVVPEPPKNEEQPTLKRRLLGFLKNTLKIIPLMNKTSEGTDLNQNQETKENSESTKKKEEYVAKSARFQSKTSSEKESKMMDSDSAVFEIDELNSTIAPSSSRQCIVGTDLECGVCVKKPKKKKKPVQRTEFHPNPPFSCVPIYTAILIGLLIVLIVGAVTTIVDMRPVFIYGEPENSIINKTLTSIVEPPQPILFSTLKPQ